MCDSKAGAMGTAAEIQQKPERAPHCKARATAEVKNGHKASLQRPRWAGRLQLILGSHHAVRAGNSHDPLIKQVSFEDYMSTYLGQMTSHYSWSRVTVQPMRQKQESVGASGKDSLP